MEFEHDLERKNFWIIQYGDAIFLMVRDDAEFRYCPNCGKPINKDYEVENDEGIT